LSYAPTASGKVGTNLNYTIRLYAALAQLRLIFAPSVVISLRRNLDFDARLRHGQIPNSGSDSNF